MQPSSPYTEKDVAWKEETSTHDPSVICSGGPNTAWTYAYIPDFDKYYFVEDAVTLDLTRTMYILSEDVMASNKTEIGNSYSFIEYATTGYNKLIPDERLTMKQSRTIMGSGDTVNPIFDSTGCYILSTLSKYDADVGVAACWALDDTNMGRVAQALCDTSLAQSLCNLFHGDLMSGILGCIWVPYPYPGTNVNLGIWVGDQIISCDAHRFTTFAERQGTFQIPIFLRYSTDDFRSYEPYTTGTIYLPGAGNVELNMSEWYGSQNINVHVSEEWFTGDVTYLLFHDNGALIHSVACNVASECPLGEQTSHYEEAGNALVGSVGGGAAGAALGIGTAILAFMRHRSTISGHIGGRGTVLWPYITHAEWSIDTEDPFDDLRRLRIGAPVGDVGKISDYSGYIKCRDANVMIAGSARERDEINAMMNSGFYYE